MKFKLVETYNDYELDDLRDLAQEYIYDAVDQLKSAPVETYLEWFKEQLSEYDDIKAEDLETVVTDVYIEATDSGKIKRPKTMITSQLKDYIESNSNLLDSVDELMNNCPEHLRHELQLALDVAELNESLNESGLNSICFYHYSNEKYVEGDKIVKNTTLKTTIVDSYNTSIPNHDCQKYVYMLDALNSDYADEYEYVYEVVPKDPVKCRMEFSPMLLNYDISRLTKQTGLQEHLLIYLFTKAYVGDLDNDKLKALCCLLGYNTSDIHKFEYISSDVTVKKCFDTSDN